MEILNEYLKKRTVKKTLEKQSSSKLQPAKKPEKTLHDETIKEKPSTSYDKACKIKSKKVTNAKRETSERKLEEATLTKLKQVNATTYKNRFSEEQLDKNVLILRNKSVVWTKESGSRKWFPKKGELNFFKVFCSVT